MQQKIQTFLNTCLRRIFNIRCPEKIRNEELWERAGQEPVAKQAGGKAYSDQVCTIIALSSINDLSAIDQDSIPIRISYTGTLVRSFGYAAQELVIASGGVDTTYYCPNGEWSLKNTWSETQTDTYSTVTYWFKFKRKPEYYGLNLILPVIMLSVLSVLIFVLPAESGEMMGFSVTLLLTFIVFAQVLASMIPTTSESTSFFGENRDVTKVKKRQLRKTAAKYTIREDVLYHDGILVAKRNQVPEILQEFHDNYVSGGHLGMNKTYKKVLERYFWHGMKQEVEDYCRSCCVCQNMNACRKKPAAPLHPIPVPKKKWSLVGMDIIGPLQVTDRGNQYIVALTDHFTKFPVAKAIPCKSSEEVARFMYETICIFGAFDSLITDQGREFINFALDILTDRFNINHRISSAYHPETNGQRERDNRTLKDTLVKITDNDDWDELLPAALFAYRTSVHKSTQFSPFLALYGEQAKLPFDVTGDANEQDLNEEIMDTMKGIHEEVKNKIGENISRAQKKQKEYYDSRRAYDHGFRIGDKVLIINAARVHRMGGKMAPRFVGPYEVISVLPKGRLQLKNTKKVYVVIVLGFNAFSVTLSIFNLAIYHHPEDEAVPDWARRLTAFFQRPCCGSNKSRTSAQHVRPVSSHVEGTINRSSTTPMHKLNRRKAEEADEEDEKDEGITWKVMAAVFDGVLLRVYIILIAFVTVLFIGLIASGE
nr:hypothetical protein BaRGS_024347 [Batillaria attramentaria]